MDKLSLDGRFRIDDGRFTDSGVQEKVNDLSRRARGRKVVEEVPSAKVTSDFAGRFKLGKRTPVARGAELQHTGGGGDAARRLLAAPGNAVVRRRPQHGRETVGDDHRSQVAAAENCRPHFRRNGKTVVPLKIAGSRNDPKFALRLQTRLQPLASPRGASGVCGASACLRSQRRASRYLGHTCATSFQNAGEWSIRFRCMSS